MLWLLLSTAAHAQDVAAAADAMATGTIGDYTGPVSIVVGVLFALDKAGMLRLGRGQEPPPPAENAQTAALDARLKSAENAVTDLQRRADESQVQRTQYQVALHVTGTIPHQLGSSMPRRVKLSHIKLQDCHVSGSLLAGRLLQRRHRFMQSLFSSTKAVQAVGLVHSIIWISHTSGCGRLESSQRLCPLLLIDQANTEIMLKCRTWIQPPPLKN